MEAAVTGATGLVGTEVSRQLIADGHSVRPVSRSPGAGRIVWDPGAGHLDAAELEGIDAVVHLAGETISGIWTAEKKQRIRDSRIQGTTLLAERLAGLQRKPRVLVSASAIGYYGAMTDGAVTESAPAGAGFLAEVCQAWEAATATAEAAGIRVVHLRIGIVLSPNGGALAALGPLFKSGLGGPIGDGHRYMSWITNTDLARAACFCLAETSLSGPVNAVAPNPVTNAAFTRALGAVVRRPTLLPAPPVMMKLLLGELAEQTLLSDCRVLPAKLNAAGFTFEHPEIRAAFEAIMR